MIMIHHLIETKIKAHVIHFWLSDVQHTLTNKTSISFD